jgi:hypothetical protein
MLGAPTATTSPEPTRLVKISGVAKSGSPLRTMYAVNPRPPPFGGVGSSSSTK